MSSSRWSRLATLVTCLSACGDLGTGLTSSGSSWLAAIVIEGAPRTMVTGEEVQLTARGITRTCRDGFCPEGSREVTVTWTSSDRSVLVVDANGRLRAAGVGRATITARKDAHAAVVTITVGP
jgi:hypothetical protein